MVQDVVVCVIVADSQQRTITYCEYVSFTGLRARFSERIHFEDFNVPLICKLLQKKLLDKKIVIPLSISDHIRNHIAPQLRNMLIIILNLLHINKWLH